MKLVYFLGCVTVAIVVTPTEGLLWPKKEDPYGGIEVGLVKQKKSPIVPQAPQKPEDLIASSGSLVPDEQTKRDGENPLQDPKATAVVAAGATAVSVIQNKIQENNQKASEIEKKLSDLNKDLNKKDRDDSLSDILEHMIQVQSQRTKMKWALGVYSFVNLILFLAGYATSLITPPVAKVIYGLEFLMKRVAAKPLDKYYANYVEAQSELGAKWLAKHEDLKKHVELGRQISITTRDGRVIPITVFKMNPGDQIDPKNMRFTDKNAFEVGRMTFKMKR